VGFLKKALGFEPTQIKLLSANIVTDEDHRYFVSFSKHHPQLQLPEFVRLVLHYYAKMLFNFDPSDPDMSQSAFILKNMVHTVIAKGISNDSNIFQIADIDDAATMVSSSPGNVPRKIVATLLFVTTTERQINTDIPRNVYAQHMVFSVMALLQAALREMDQDCIDYLNRALANMNAAYDSGQSYSDMLNLAVIPNNAYLSAIMGEGQSKATKQQPVAAQGSDEAQEGLSKRFWDLDNEAKAKFLQPYFLKHCVDPAAKDMATALLEHVPQTKQIFQGEEGAKYLAGELGAMVIDGYIAGRLSMGDLPESHPILGIQPKELQDHLHSQVLDHSKGVKIDLGEGGLNELLVELVTVRLNMKGFKDVEDHETFKKYLVLMLFNGMGWATAEKDIIG